MYLCVCENGIDVVVGHCDWQCGVACEMSKLMNSQSGVGGSAGR